MSDAVQSAASQARHDDKLWQFLIGQDDEGRWLAVETHNWGGGLFKTRQDAVHFAELETDRRPGSVLMAESRLRLTF